MQLTKLSMYLATAGIVASGIAACGGGSSSSSGSTGVTLTGAVSAPNGTIAFNDSSNFLTRLASLFIPDAVAQAASGTFSGVGAGVKVELIEIDSTGAKVGNALASTTTNSTGGYTLTAPDGFVPASKYVIRATGTSGTMDAFVTGTTVDVDPVTNTTKTLILASSPSLSSITTSEVTAVQNEIQAIANDGSLSYTSASDASTQLKTLAQSSEETSNIVGSITAAGSITGKVTDASGNPLANIKIVVRDFGNWVTRAVAWTDANGNYTLNVAAGNYILGAINSTSTSTAASEWWTADNGAGATNQNSAAKVTVGGGTPFSGNFQLKNGTRINGTVSGSGTGLGGVKVMVRDFTNDQPVTPVLTKADGTYVMNVRPGTYTLSAVNETSSLMFATSYYGASGSMVAKASSAAPITASSGMPVTASFTLPAGTLVTGVIKDAPTGTAQTGATVRIYENTDSTGAFVNATRTDLTGNYRFWLPSTGSYHVRARGQTVTVTAAGTTLTNDFTAPVAAITGNLVDSSGNPVSQVKVGVYDAVGNYLGHEPSSADGSFTTYTASTNNLVEFKVDSGASIGSQIYNGVTSFGSATTVTGNISTPTSLGSVTLPSGFPLTGTVIPPTGERGNYIVQVRSGGGTNGFINRFMNTRTQLDGSYSVSLPGGPGTTYLVRACPAGVTAGPTVAPFDGSGLTSSACSRYASVTMTAATSQNF